MSHSGQGRNVAKTLYTLCSKLPNDRWKEFARVKLKLPESKIDDVQHNHRENIREQKYEALNFWQRQNDDVAYLEILLKQFLMDDCDEGLSDQKFDIVIVHDDTVSSQIGEAKKLLGEEGWPSVEAVACIPKPNPSTISHVRRFKYKIFILTGGFQVTILPDFLSIIEEGSDEDTLLLTRKAGLSNEIANVNPTTIRSFNDKEIFARIQEFLRKRVPNQLEDLHEEKQFFTRSPGRDAQESTYFHDDDDTDKDGEEEDPGCYEKYFPLLKEKGFPDSYHDAKYANILIVGSVRGRMPELQSIASIPWLRVFDFDPKSRVLGFLSNLESTLRSLRHVTVTDAQDKVEIPDDRTTNWVFINGYCDSDFKEYKDPSEVSSKAVFTHFESLVNYCVGRKVPKIVVLWYPSVTNYDEGLDLFMSSLRYHFKSQLNSFFCIFCIPEIPNKHSERSKMIKRLKLEENVVVIPLKVLCKWITESDLKSEPLSESKTLPQFSQFKGERGTFVLKEKDYKWLGVCFDLVGSNDHKSGSGDTGGEDFLKGGKLRWEILATGNYDAARDILADKVKLIKKRYLETGKSGIITIFHPPGGGGTTFARRLLWELRKDSPCLELISMELSIDEVKKRLSFIRNETHLPAVLLIDGNSSMDVKTLLENCRYEKVVILHVQRFYSSHKALSKKKKTDIIWVPESVSKTEATCLQSIFSSVKPDQKIALKRLTEDVHDNKSHCMFEYGLTAYDSEYRGVKSYVHGNLCISRETELTDWHKVLTYLSLVHYYGHCALPSKLFATLLGKSDDETVLLDDLPHLARKFVIENQEGEWRISYYIIAKKGLEQVLVRRSEPEFKHIRENSLSQQARKNLCNIAIDFIRFVKQNLDHLHATEIPAHMQDILTSTLIKRNYKDAGENDEFGSRSKYSRLIEHAPEEHRQNILESLVESFPANAEFHAHLGRFYGTTKQFQKAEDCFLKAFEVRKTEKKKRPEKNMNSSGDPVLHRIHSMFGFYLNEQIRITIQKGDVKKQTVSIILEKAESAIMHFQKSKHYYQKGCNPTYVFIGEIKVRLLLAGYADKLTRGQVASLMHSEEPYRSLCIFVFESFSYCDQLLVQCMHHAEEHSIPQDELDTCINNFNAFFKNTEMALRHWVGNDRSVHSKKCHVAILKLDIAQNKKEIPSKFQIYELTDLGRLKELIKLYEGIFYDAQCPGLEHHLISNYMLEWLQAIRHPGLKESSYTLTRVNSCVEQWHAKKERGSLATFYHYVLKTLLAINSPRGEVNSRYSEQSCLLKEGIKDCMVPRPLIERTAEWLAESEDTQSFRNLIHRNLLGEWDGKFWKREKAALLRVCKGKITTCKIWYGHIVLDGGHRPEITVFFNPQRYGFSGSDSKQKIRVEFYVGFNPNHGAEAYQVSRMDKTPCPECRTPTEISKLGKDPEGWSGRCPKCEKEVCARG